MYGFRAFVFNGKKTAGKALDTLEDHVPVYPWIDAAAVVSRSKLGIIRIHSTWAQDDSAVDAGTGLGALTGGLLGVLLGPGGALAGAAMGGSMGALFGVADEIAFDDPRLDDFANSLAKDTSALILVAEEPTLRDFTSAVQPFGGEDHRDQPQRRRRQGPEEGPQREGPRGSRPNPTPGGPPRSSTRFEVTSTEAFQSGNIFEKLELVVSPRRIPS